MKFELAHYVQRGHHFAIVDEVDSILIDEARTPLIISGPGRRVDRPLLRSRSHHPAAEAWRGHAGQRQGRGSRSAREATGDYIVDEKHKTVTLTESGMAKAEKLLAHRLQPGGLYDPANMPLLHHVDQALRAHALFKLDVDYMIKDGGVVIVDEFTGRLMPGRRWSDGLHQAVEAKEKVKIERENQTLATITFQNYFRKYKKLSGHDRHRRHRGARNSTRSTSSTSSSSRPTGAAPHRRARPRLPDRAREVRGHRQRHPREAEEGRPVLVGTVSIEKSERLSKLLKLRGIKHVVLNAKYHAQEAEIVAQAGRKGTVTIATNMAGRGTDILLGGNPEFMARQQTLAEEIAETAAEGRGEVRRRRRVRLLLPPRQLLPRAARRTTTASSPHFKTQTDAEHDEVVALGGLHIVGTERHEARRIDNQLRGRAGRQGDPGLVALLSVARRRPDAHLRIRPHRRADAAPRAWKKASPSSTRW